MKKLNKLTWTAPAVSLDARKAMIIAMQLRICCSGNAIMRHAIDVYNNMSLSWLLTCVKYDEQCDVMLYIAYYSSGTTSGRRNNKKPGWSTLKSNIPAGPLTGPAPTAQFVSADFMAEGTKIPIDQGWPAINNEGDDDNYNDVDDDGDDKADVFLIAPCLATRTNIHNVAMYLSKIFFYAWFEWCCPQ